MKLRTWSAAYHYEFDDAMKRFERWASDQKDFAKQVLSWIICAKRLFTMLDLQCGGPAVEIGESELDEQNLPQIEDMSTMCIGLVNCGTSLKVLSAGAMKEFERRLQSNLLYNYAAHNWGHHSRLSRNIDAINTFFETYGEGGSVEPSTRDG